MFEHFIQFPWVLPVYHYTDQANLLQTLKENVLDPTVQKAKPFRNVYPWLSGATGLRIQNLPPHDV